MEEEKGEEPGQESEKKKKKKKKKAGGNDAGQNQKAVKDSSVPNLLKYVENFCFKIFEDKYESTEDQKWAKSTCDPDVYHSVPCLQNKKIFEQLDFKKSQQFYLKMYKYIRDLFTLGKTMQQSPISSYQLL